MTKKNFNHSKAIYVVTIVSILFTASGLRAEERLPSSKAISETTKEFLSDRARTGSLLGSILVGAAVPNPLSPLLGSLAGFLIGKRSAYTKNESNAARRQASNNRSLIPEDDRQVTSLAGLTGKQPPTSEQDVMLGLSGEPGTGYQSEQNEQVVIVGNTPIASAGRSLSKGTGTGHQSEQNEQLVIVGNTPIASASRSLSKGTGTGHQSEQNEQLVIVGNTPIISAVRSLSEETGTGYQSDRNEQIIIVGNTPTVSAIRSLSGESGTGYQSQQTEQTAAVEKSTNSSAIRLFSGETEARNNLQQQLAFACNNMQLTQSMSLGCYYHSQ
jgi:hypothetical protein